MPLMTGFNFCSDLSELVSDLDKMIVLSPFRLKCPVLFYSYLSQIKVFSQSPMAL